MASAGTDPCAFLLMASAVNTCLTDLHLAALPVLVDWASCSCGLLPRCSSTDLCLTLPELNLFMDLTCCEVAGRNLSLFLLFSLVSWMGDD